MRNQPADSGTPARDAEALRSSREYLDALVEASPLAIVAMDEAGRIALWSPAAERLFGWSSTEVIGEPNPVVPATKSDEFGRMLARVLRGKGFTGLETERRRRDGTLVEVRISSAPLRDEAGRIHGSMAVFEDITEHRRAEREREQLLEVERSLRKATEAVSTMFTIDEVTREIAQSALEAVDADGAFVERVLMDRPEVEVVCAVGSLQVGVGLRQRYAGSLTEAVLEHAGLERIERLAESPWRLPGRLGEDCPDCTALVVHLANAGGAVGALILLRRADREPFGPVEIDRARTFAELAGVGYRKIHLLEDAERRTEELERIMASRGRLMRGFSHDVKNPLGAADGYLELLELGVKAPLADAQKEYVAKVRRSIHGALDLIDDLLELARAEQGQIDIEEGPVDVRAAAREVAEEYRAFAEAKGLELRCELPGDAPVIRSDRSRVHQILGNLVSNAVKYTDRGWIAVRVVMEGGDEPGGRIGVEVQDTGRGIPEDKQPLLFQEFTRLDTGGEHGAGLGLAISRFVARALGGDVSVVSAAGQGSTFTLWLPIRERSAKR